jgi:hypothetical protein
MGFAFFGRKLQCQSASAPGGGDRERFLILLYNSWVFYLLPLHAVQDCCSWGLARRGGRSMAKRRSVGGSVLDKTTPKDKAFRRKERGALGSTSIIMAFSGKDKEGGEARVGEFFSFSHVLSVSSLFSDFVDIFETPFSLIALPVCLCLP